MRGLTGLVGSGQGEGRGAGDILFSGTQPEVLGNIGLVDPSVKCRGRNVAQELCSSNGSSWISLIGVTGRERIGR